MTRWQVVAMVLTALVLASLACSAVTPTPTAPPPLPTAAATSTPAATSTTAALPTKAPASTYTPKPSATDTRAPTAKATTAALPAGVLFTDDFGSQKASESKGWVFETGENVDTAWAANKYIVSVKKQNWLGLNWPDGTYDNFGAEVEGLITGGSYAEYGLIFRVSGDKDARSYYLFGVTTDGKYYLQKKINGQWADKDPVPATVSSYVKPKAKNTLGVLAQGNNISLYINSFLVKTVTDDTSLSGMAGMYAGTGSNNTSAQVTFSRLTVLTADKAKAEWGAAPAAEPTARPAATAKPTATATKSAGTGTGNGTFRVQNSFSGFCRVNLWGQKTAEISAEGNTTKSLSLPPGTYGAKITLGNGREGDVPNQFYLPAGGYCTIICYEKAYGGPYCGQ